MGWLFCVALAWAAAGRHVGILDWTILTGSIALLVAIASSVWASAIYRRLLARHQRFEQDGAKDVQRLADIARSRFRAGHCVLAGLVLLLSAVAARMQSGLPVSAFLLGLGLVPFIVIAGTSWRLQRGAEAAVAFLEPVVPPWTRLGREAIAQLTHQRRIEDALSRAYGPKGSVASLEVLGVLRHAQAFWPKLEERRLVGWADRLQWPCCMDVFLSDVIFVYRDEALV